MEVVAVMIDSDKGNIRELTAPETTSESSNKIEK